MDDINYMISILSEFLSEEKEELVFLDLWDKTPDIVPLEEVFHAQHEFKSERQAKYIQVYGGDPRSGAKASKNINIVLNVHNAVVLKELCKQQGLGVSTLIRKLVHKYLRENNIEPFFLDIKNKYEKKVDPVMETQSFDLEEAHRLQFEDQVVDPQADIICQNAHHPTQRQNRWYWRRNAKRYS